MAAGQTLGGDDLRALAEQKEKEWRDLQQLRLESLESALKQKDKELNEEQAKLNQLKDDFKYNFKLLHERDAELDKYDNVFAELKTTMNNKNAEVSELHIKIDNLTAQLGMEQEQKNEMQRHYQQRIREKQAEVDKYRCDKDKEVNQERNQLESFKRNLERQLREVEEELDIQRQELNAGFEEALRKREHEFRVQVDEMSGTVLAHEMKVKLLSKELEILKTTHEKTAEEYTCIDGQQRELEKELKRTKWELADTNAMKDARISELEINIHQAELSKKRMQEEFQRKHAELDKYCREKEACLNKTKEAHSNREHELQATIQELQSNLEQKDIEIRRLNWTHGDLLKDKDQLIEKLQDEVTDVKDRGNSYIEELSRTTVERDVELQRYKDNDEGLKTQLSQRKLDVERYKKELKDSVDREAALERSKAQLDLDWQRRYEDVERGMYAKSEDFVKSLTSARDQAMAEVKELKRLLQQREDLIKTLNKDRSEAFATLQLNNIPIDRKAELVESEGSLQASDLKKQNENLRNVIRQMRQEMEQLGQTLPPGGGDTETKGVQDYNKSIESELSHVKAKNRELQLEIDRLRASGGGSTLSESALKEVGDNPMVRTHVESLNSMVGSLRSEKMELAAQVKKSQARIQYLENLNDQLSKQPRQKQVEIDQLQYELGAQNRRYQTEVSSLRHRVAELELQLIETRKEADEYYKGNLERNMEAVALGNELSNLKVDLAKKHPVISYGAQELVIQQLQDEITRLRKVVGGNMTFDPSSLTTDPVTGHGSSSAAVDQLKQKLRMAANHISQLAKEKQQLIQVGNKLRAELTRAGLPLPMPDVKSQKISGSHVSHPPGGSMKSGPLAQKVQNKLNQLEKLQYQLTKQELQFAQQGGQNQGYGDIQVESSSSDTPPGGGYPKSILKPSEPPPAPRYDYYVNEAAERPESGYSKRPTTAETDYRPASASTSRDQPLMTSMSSMGGESLQEVWKILDNPQSPSVFTPQPQGQLHPSSESEENRPPSSFTVKGVPKQAQGRPKSSKNLSAAAAGKIHKKPAAVKPKIRNYNVRDESNNR